MGEWQEGRPSVVDFIIQKFGEKHVNATYVRQFKTYIEPLILMRNAVEHPKPTELVITNFVRDGNVLRQPTWSVVKDGKAQYGPLSILDELSSAVRNLLVWAEDHLIIWAQVNLETPAWLVEVRVVREGQRNADCPVKYRIQPTDAVLANIAAGKTVATT